jgi:hypothetical protein
MKNIQLLSMAAVFSASALTCDAALSVLDSGSFANQYNGDQIFDGTNTINQWVANGGATDANLALDGSNAVVTLTDTNGWVEHDDGTTPWETGVGSWTVEVRANISANGDAGGFVIWGALNGQRDIMTVRESSITNLAGDVFSMDLNVGSFHNFRIAYDADDNVYHYFRDTVQITPLEGIPQQAGTANTRLIVGDCCTSVGGATLGGPGTVVEYEYIRYDNTGAFAPVPEPTAAALFGLAGLGLILRRRRSA